MAHRHASAHVRWANNAVTSSGVADDVSFTVLSVVGRRIASVTGRVASPTEVEQLVRASEAACRHRPEAPDYMPLLGNGLQPDDWQAPPVTTDIHVFDSLVPTLAGVFERARRSDVQTFGSAAHRASTVWLATSTGLRRRHSDRIGTITITAKTPDFTQSSWSGAATEDFTDVDVAHLCDRLEQGLAWSRRRIALPAGEYEVLLQPSCTSDLAVAAYASMTRRRADEGSSPFSSPMNGTRIGERIFGDVSMYSDPHEPGMSATPFQVAVSSRDGASVFDNGLPVRRTEWVRNGELLALVTPRYWAAKAAAGGPVAFVNNLIVSGSGPTLEEMIARTDRALLVTSFWYMAVVDPRQGRLTGLTRDGVFLVERGAIVGAVNDFRWTMSPMAAFSQVTEIGQSARAVPRDHEGFQRAKAPPVRVDRFAMSGVADAG